MVWLLPVGLLGLECCRWAAALVLQRQKSKSQILKHCLIWFCPALGSAALKDIIGTTDTVWIWTEYYVMILFPSWMFSLYCDFKGKSLCFRIHLKAFRVKLYSVSRLFSIVPQISNSCNFNDHNYILFIWRQWES